MGWERWGWLDEWGYDVERETEIWVSKGEHECLRDALAFACPNRPIAAEDLWGKSCGMHFIPVSWNGVDVPALRALFRARPHVLHGGRKGDGYLKKWN
jgi:hypothetical protein